MPFGLCNAPPNFQLLMSLQLSRMLRHTRLAYIDNVIVFGDTSHQHQEGLDSCLRKLLDANSKLKPEKCVFSQSKDKFMGHGVSAKILKMYMKLRSSLTG